MAADSAFDMATNPKAVTANCPSGEVAIAGGGQVFVSTATDTVALRTSGPVVGGDTQPTSGVPTGWRVNGVAIGSPGNWSDRAYAICAHTAANHTNYIFPPVEGAGLRSFGAGPISRRNEGYTAFTRSRLGGWMMLA